MLTDAAAHLAGFVGLAQLSGASRRRGQCLERRPQRLDASGHVRESSP
jgi:hypothetical protein